MTTGDWILLVVYLFGILGLGWWIKILKGAVDAQRKTIEAQGTILTDFKDLSATMKGVLESTDEPKMLERVKAYKEFVDKEKDAAIKTERDRAGGGIKQVQDMLIDEVISRIETYSKLIMYVPPNARKEVIESLPKLKYLPEQKARTVYEEMASKAPYLLQHRFITTGDVFPEGPVMPPEHTEPGEKLKERMTKIEDKD